MPGLRYRFGAYRIDLSARELHHAGELATLSPKVFDCLAYLIEHRDRAVGRDELIAAVWGKADVSDTLLGQTVLKARRAVGDTGGDQNAIRTVPRFGYRWVAAVQPELVETAVAAEPEAGLAGGGEPAAADAAAAIPATQGAPDIPAAAARKSILWPWLALSIAAVLALASGLAYRHAKRPAAPAAADATAPKPIPDAAAVLPVDVDAGGEWAWLRLGLMDLIATRLRGGGQTVVPADNVVALVRDADEAPASRALRVREATGARYTVLPQASRSGAEWVVRLLLRPADGAEREVEARSGDVIEAGRIAADRLLAALGRQPPPTLADTPDAAIAERLSRAEAALLTDDLDGARRLLEGAPADARKSPPLRLRLAQIDFRAGQLEHGSALLQALKREVRPEDDPVLRARILIASGAFRVRRDRAADAAHDYGEAIALLENRNQPAALGQAYMGRGIAHAQEQQLDLATADFSRARIALELAGDTLALARVEANEGLIDARRLRYPAALSSYEHAAQHFERFGALNELVLTLANIADAQLALLRPADALATSDRAWALLGRLENPITRYESQVTRAEALGANGRLLEARALQRELLAGPPLDGGTAPLARVQALQARVDLGDGDAAAAAVLAAAAVAGITSADDARTRAGAWLTLIRALRAQGRDDEAAAEVERFAAWTATTAETGRPAAAALATAEQRWAERHLEAARDAYDAALRQVEQQSVPREIAEVVISYGSSLIVDGELERATAVVGQIARWADRDYGCALLQVRLYRALGHEDAWRTALQKAHALAGERRIPPQLASPPGAAVVGQAGGFSEEKQVVVAPRTMRE